MLQAIKTKFGTVYIEELNSEREEKDRIKIFDSEQKYMDYFSLPVLESFAKAENHTLEEEYRLRIKNIIECDTIDDLLGCILWWWELITVDWFEVADYLKINDSDKQRVLEELQNNECVNKIGDYYVITEH